MAYDALFRPIRLGKVDVSNRVFMPPHTTCFADRVSTPQLTDYYVERAANGIGLIVHEGLLVHPSTAVRNRIWGWLDENVAPLTRTADAVHAAGARIVCQLSHKGPQMTSDVSGEPVWVPSVIPGARSGEQGRAITRDDIRELIDAYLHAAALCARAGFDGVEVHAAHGYLVHCFLSARTNRREDDYGSDRARLLLEILRALRLAMPSGFVIGVRLSGDEPSVTSVAARAAHDCDYISVSAGDAATYDRVVPDFSYPPGVNVEYAAMVKRGVDVPVLVAGRISDASLAEAVVSSGAADMVGLARAFIADPEWLAKVARGFEEDIRPCTYSNVCRGRIGAQKPLRCTVNPDVGNVVVRTRARQAKRVAVVGGGLAGMECALGAAHAGHEVVLFEAQPRLGGQVQLAASTASRRELARIGTHLAGAVERAGVDLRLETKATVDGVLAEHPDVVVVATGAVPRRPDIDDGTITALDVLDGADVGGPHVVVVDDGDNAWPLFVTIERLLALGRSVDVATPAAALGVPNVDVASLAPITRHIYGAGVGVHVLHRLERFGDRRAVLRHVYTGHEITIADVDAVVVERGRVVDDRLVGAFPAAVDVRVIGDARAPRTMADAIREGRAVARSL